MIYVTLVSFPFPGLCHSGLRHGIRASWKETNQAMVRAFFGKGFLSQTEQGDGKCHTGSTVMDGQHEPLSMGPVLSTLDSGQ